MPVNFIVLAILPALGKNKAFITEEAKAVRTDFICLADYGCGFIGQVSAEQLGAGRCFTTVKKKLSFLRRVPKANRCGAHTGFATQQIAALMHLLREARADLVPVHMGNTRQLVLPSGSHRLSYLTCWEIVHSCWS